MQSFAEGWRRLEAFLTSGIAGSEFTPLRLLTVLVMVTVLVWVTRRVTRWLIDRVLARRGFEIGVREAVGAILRYVVISLGALVILQAAGIDLTSLNVLVGAIGVGLGFGLQNITSNFFSGLILLFERPIRIGDRVEIAGCVGEVKEIAARATTLVTDENVAIIVPNSQLVSERVVNWSQPGTLTAYLIPFYVSHTSDPELVRQALLAAAGRHRDVLQQPAPEVEFVEAGLGALRFQLQVWSSEHLKTAGTLRSDLNFEVWRQLVSAGVTISPAHGAMALGVPLIQESRG
jgi:small-conductance mechanosensitive channel